MSYICHIQKKKNLLYKVKLVLRRYSKFQREGGRALKEKEIKSKRKAG